ncbi:MAG: tetratricopeptide repeat protein, partial [bacterium]
MMRKELRRVQRHLLPAIVTFLAAFILSSANTASGQVFSEKENSIEIDYLHRLQFYMDQISKDYLIEMAAREKMLLQLVANVSAEVKSRGTNAILSDDPSFVPLYEAIDNLIMDYGQELDQVLGLIAEIDSMKNILEDEKRYGMADLFSSLKDSLVTVIDNRNLHKLLPKTKVDLANMMQEYNLEIDSLVTFYGNLAQMEQRLDPIEDRALLERITQQKQNIAGYLKLAVPDSTLSELTDAYSEETDQLLKVMSGLEDIQKQALEENPNVVSDIDQVKRDVLANMDARMLDLLGYGDFAPQKGAGLNEIFREWRLTRLADFESKYHEYLVMKTSLIASADAKERSRMLQRDLSDALLNYVDRRYMLAELQLDRLIADYGQHFTSFDAVYFFRAEAKYARLHYQQAYNGYKDILQNYPDSQYNEDIYLRLLTIAQTLNWRKDFFKYYNDFLSIEESISAKVRNRVHYLAGYYSLQNRDTKNAKDALERIEKNSKYYLPGLYLSGVTLANRTAYEGAIRVFKSIVNMDNMPWADPNLALIRNNALLKLGFIYYERGEYEQALSYFEAVSRGADGRDKVLIGTAWANLKAGSYEQTVGYVDELFQNFLSSNYTYEALVLAAHCKRLLNQPDEAMRDLRYVTKARGVLELANDYNLERRNILQQLDELEKMEESVLDAQNKNMFNLVSDLKTSVQRSLISLGYKSGVGTQLLDEFDNERTEIYKQIRELDTIIETASQVGNKEVLKDASARRDRLVKTLATYRSDKMIGDVNYFLDYPLATKESSTKYRKRIIRNLLRDMDNEKKRINGDLVSMRALLAKGEALQAGTFVEL